MVGGIAALASWMAAALALPLAGDGEVTVVDRDVAVGEVFDLSGLAEPLRADIGAKVLLTLPRHADAIEIGADRLGDLLRRRIPGLGLRHDQGARRVTIRLDRTVQRAVVRRGPPACRALAVDLVAGAIVRAKDVRPVGCRDDTPEGEVVFDRLAGAPRAAGPLRAGAYLGRFAPSPFAVDRGTVLTFATAVGPVRIERQVRAAQPARAGAGLFVADAEGRLFATRFQPLDDGRDDDVSPSTQLSPQTRKSGFSRVPEGLEARVRGTGEARRVDEGGEGPALPTAPESVR